MAEQSKTVTFDTDFEGSTFRDFRSGLAFRRYNGQVLLGFIGGQSAWLDPEQAEALATSLFAAATAGRTAGRDATGRLPGCTCGLTGPLDNPVVEVAEKDCPHHGALVVKPLEPGGERRD